MKKDTKVAKVAKIHISEERNHGRRAVARQEAAGKGKEAREKTGHVGLVVKKRTHCSVVSNGRQQQFVGH